jgi:hypothetical protein
MSLYGDPRQEPSLECFGTAGLARGQVTVVGESPVDSFSTYDRRGESGDVGYSVRPSGRKNQAIRPPHAQMPAAAIIATRKAEVAAA